MALFASLFRKKKVNEVVSASNPIELLPPELKDEFKTSGIPISDLETREDWILLLNCFFFGSARHDYRPLPELLQEYDEFQKQHSTDSQASMDFGSTDSSGPSPMVVRKRSGSLKKGAEAADRRSPPLERIVEGVQETGESSKKSMSKVPSTGNVSNSSSGHSASQHTGTSSGKSRRVSRSSSSNDSLPSHSSEGLLVSGAGSTMAASRETSPHTTPPLLRSLHNANMPAMSLGPSSTSIASGHFGMPGDGSGTTNATSGSASSFSGMAGPLQSSHHYRTGSLSPDLRPIRVRSKPSTHSLQGDAANLIEAKLGGVGDLAKLPSVYEPSASESESGVTSDQHFDLLHNTDALLGLLQPIVITDPTTTTTRTKSKSGKGSISPERARKRGERENSNGSSGGGANTANLSQISYPTPGTTQASSGASPLPGVGALSSATATTTSTNSAVSPSASGTQHSPHLAQSPGGSSATSDRSAPISHVHHHHQHHGAPTGGSAAHYGQIQLTGGQSPASASSPLTSVFPLGTGSISPATRRAEGDPVASPNQVHYSGSWTAGSSGGLAGSADPRAHDGGSRRSRRSGSTNLGSSSSSRHGARDADDSDDDDYVAQPRGRTSSPHFSPVHGHRSRSASPMSYQGEGRLLANTASRTPIPLLEDHFQMEDATHTYKLLEKLGKGSFGNVYIAKMRKEKSSKRYAIKKCAIDTRRKVQTICREIGNLRNANHPNVVKFIGSYYHKETAWIVMEYCDAGTLRDLRYATTLEEQHIAYVMRELLKGLSYMHSAGMMHRDIKGENVLLSVQGDVKVADLGLAVPAVDDQKRIAGSKYWMAPEMILAAGYGPKADIYSLGCTAYELADGLPPYAQHNAIRALFCAAKHGFPPLDCPKAWSADFLNFLACCSHPNPRDRPSSIDLLSHPFLNKACSKSDFAKLIASAFVMGSFHGFDI